MKKLKNKDVIVVNGVEMTLSNARKDGIIDSMVIALAKIKITTLFGNDVIVKRDSSEYNAYVNV